MRSAASYARKAPRFSPQQKVLILCEDTHSSLQYMQKATQALRAAADVKVSHCGKNDPLGIVNAAIESKSKYDEIFCVIDRDRHENFHKARELVDQHIGKISLIVSNPCFEYWLILHFKYTRSPFTEEGNKSPGDVALSRLRKISGMDNYQKGNAIDIYRTLEDKLSTAEKNAAKSLKEAENDNEFNPSTQIHLVISKFRELGSPR